MRGASCVVGSTITLRTCQLGHLKDGVRVVPGQSPVVVLVARRGLGRRRAARALLEDNLGLGLDLNALVALDVRRGRRLLPCRMAG